MISRRSAHATFGLGLAVLGAAACGGSVHDEGVPSTPLVTLAGHVDLASLQRAHPEAPLLGALVWGAVPGVNPLCLTFDHPAIVPACPDPYGVFYGIVEDAALVDADGNFTLTLDHLPKASVSVGDEVTRIAWGSLIVLEDVDGNGEPSLLAGGNLGGGGPRGNDEPAPLAENPDVIVASSFHTLRDAQTRVAFREGGFVEDSFFYPVPGCAGPPPGFSFFTAPPYAATPPGGGCAALDITTRVEVPALTPADALAFACRSVQRSSRLRQPRADEPPSDRVAPLCLSRDVFALVYPGICQRLRGFALKGCATDPICATPEWDQTPRPPTWWPCH